MSREGFTFEVWDRRRIPPAAEHLIRGLNRLSPSDPIEGVEALPAAVSGKLLLPILECEASGLLALAYEVGPLYEADPMMMRLLSSERRREAAQRFLAFASGRSPTQNRRRRWAQAAVYCGMGAAEALRRAAQEIQGPADWPDLPAPAEPSAIAVRRTGIT